MPPSSSDGLARLARRFALPASAAAPLEGLLAALAAPAAPTAVHDPARAIDVHLADSLVALELDLTPVAFRSHPGIHVADLGAGAGIPGLVLAAALPEARVTLVESNHRKAEWARATAEACGLTNVAVAAARVEEWSDGLLACDVVTARALAALPVLVEYAAPLLRPGGRLIAWKGAVERSEAADGEHAAAALGLSSPAIHPVSPFPGSERRTLWVFEKTGPTPPGYPRRPGIATKRPLSAR